MNVSFVKTPTPVEGVVVESVTTVGPVPIGDVQNSHPIGTNLGTVIDVQATPVAETVDTVPASVTVLTPPPTTAVVVASPVTVAKREESNQLINDQDIGFDDIILPRINIVQKVGDLSEIFTPGEIVLKQTLVVYSPPKGESKGTAPLNVTVIGFRKTQFAEKVAGGAMGILAHSNEEVVKHGGTLDYKEWEASIEANKTNPAVKPLKMFQQLATALCLIEKPDFIPDTDHVEFPYENEGKYYALVFWSMKGTAYTRAAKIMFTARKIGHLRAGGYYSQSWSLSSKIEKFGENYAAIPIIKPAAKTTPGFQQFARIVAGLE